MSQPDAKASSIAEAFVTARRQARALAVYPGAEPADLVAATAIQDKAIGLFGERVAGWKVGRINTPWLEKLGCNRLPGPIFAPQVRQVQAGTANIGHVFKDGFGAAEAEFVFRLGAAPAPGTTELSLDQAAALIDAVFIGIEIASSPFPAINARGPLVTISDFGNNNGLILGAEIPDWQTSGLNDWQIESKIDGTPVGQGMASAFPDGPLGSVKFLIENLLTRGCAINPGLLISTGAVSGVHEIAAGQHFEAQFGSFGDIACTIANATAA